MPLLADEDIILNKKGDPCLQSAEAESLLSHVPEWRITREDGVEQLTRTYQFKDYLMIIDLAHKIGCMAEQVNHHPDMHVEWGKLTVSWSTHSINGLARNDFIMAARSDRVAMLVGAP